MFLHRCSQQRHSALWRRKSRDQRQKSLYKDGGKERKSEEEEEDDFELDEDDEDDDVDSPDEKDDRSWSPWLRWTNPPKYLTTFTW